MGIYYVSQSAGNDASDGLSQGTAWKTLARAFATSGYATLIAATDTVRLRANDVWSESIVIGASLTGLTVESYSTGAKPVIRGFITASGWTNNGNGTYSFINTSLPAFVNCVSLNGGFKEMSRWPRSTYRTQQSSTWPNADVSTPVSGSQSASVTDGTLSGATAVNFNDGHTIICYRARRWVLNRGKVTGHSGNTLSFGVLSGHNTAIYYKPFNNYGYFLQNHPSFLTQLGDWMYRIVSGNKTFTMHFGGDVPANHTVRISQKTTGIEVYASGVTIKGLNIEGFNNYGISLGSTAGGFTIDSCDFSYIGEYAIVSFNAIHYGTINLCNFSDLPNNGITAFSSNNWTITRNTFNRISHWAGMGGSNDSQYMGVAILPGNNTLYERNVFTNCGYVGIYYRGSGNIIRENNFDYVCYVKDDGGAIYTFEGYYLAKAQRNLVTKNIVRNSVGAMGGVASTETSKGMGIYIDEYASENDVTHNTVFQCDYGVFFHNAPQNLVQHNTFYKNKHSVYFRFFDQGMNSVSILNNIFVSSGTGGSQHSAITLDSHDTFISFGTSNFNKFFVNNQASGGYLKVAVNEAAFNNNFSSLTLAQWRSGQNKDIASTIADYSIEKFEYNPTNAPVNVALNRTYVDAAGTVYNTQVTLQPYSSVFLVAYTQVSKKVVVNGKLMTINSKLALL